MNELSTLKGFLIASIVKHGNQPLTLQHLVNIIALMERVEDARDKAIEGELDQILAGL